jgi:hypothetical protein
VQTGFAATAANTSSVRRLAGLAAALLAVAVAAPVLADSHGHGPRPPAGFWVAGDLHVHTTYGHDTCFDPTTAWDPSSTDRAARRSCEEPYTVGFTPVQRLQEAQQRGLNFVALTDHNNVVNQTDPDALAFQQANPDFVWLPAYENSQPGHVQMLGARSCFGNNGAIPGALIECDQPVTDRSAAGETALADGLRAAGGVFQINHPSDMSWLTKFGYSVVPDNVEVWNEPWFYQSPAPASNDDDFAMQWYDGFLQRGYHVGITGGSDSHWVTTDSAQGIGDPTTWVFVRSLTVQGVLDGLRAHRTFVSALPPLEHGPQLFLEADHNGDGVYEAIAGSDTSPRSSFRVRTVDALPGSTLRVVTDQGSVDVPLGLESTYDFRLGGGGIPAGSRFVRAELFGPDGQSARQQGCEPLVGSQTSYCRDVLAMEAVSSPLYLDG